jgi:hypothetical protein
MDDCGDAILENDARKIVLVLHIAIHKGTRSCLLPVHAHIGCNDTAWVPMSEQWQKLCANLARGTSHQEAGFIRICCTLACAASTSGALAWSKNVFLMKELYIAVSQQVVKVAICLCSHEAGLRDHNVGPSKVKWAYARTEERKHRNDRLK